MRALLLLLCVAVLLVSTHAAAGPFASHTVTDNPHLTSFRIESVRPDTPVCVMLPSVIGACEGFDTSQAAVSARGMMLDGSTVVSMATVRDPGANVVVLVYRHPLKGFNLEGEVIDGILRGMGNAIAAKPGTQEVEKPRRIQLGGREALRVVFEQSDHGIAARTTLVGVFGAEQLHVFMFLSPVAYEPEARKSIDHMLATLVYEPGDLGTFGVSRKELQTRRFNDLALRMGIPLAIVVIGYMVYKKRQQRAAARRS